MQYFKLEDYSQKFIIAFALMQIFFLGIIDYYTGFELSFAVFYLIPVAVSAWFVEKKFALVTSFISAATWQLSNYMAGEHYSNFLYPLWNTTTRLMFFLVVTILILKLKESFAHETVLARTDFLTGASNTRSFYELAQMEINRCRRYNRIFTIVYFDADNFKTINDTLGHHTGSDLLVKVVDVIQQNLRSTDVIARVGGDEFAILLPETDLNNAKIVVNKLRNQIQSEMDSKGWGVTFSIGVLTCVSSPETVDELIKIADELMYEVKRNGKNSVKFEQLDEEPKIQQRFFAKNQVEFTS